MALYGFIFGHMRQKGSGHKRTIGVNMFLTPTIARQAEKTLNGDPSVCYTVLSVYWIPLFAVRSICCFVVREGSPWAVPKQKTLDMLRAALKCNKDIRKPSAQQLQTYALYSFILYVFFHKFYMHLCLDMSNTCFTT